MIDVEKIVGERMDSDDAALPDQVAEIVRAAIAAALEDAADTEDRKGDERNEQANKFRKDRRLETLLHLERDFYRQLAANLRALAARYREESR